MYKPQISIIGSRNLSTESLNLVEELSYCLVEAGCRIVTGGMGSLQKNAHKGAKLSPASSDCDTIAILPGFDPKPALDHADVIIPTGLDLYRNVIVANSDVVISIDGGAGTLSELAFAWQLNRSVIAVGSDGWSSKLAGTTLDGRRPEDKLFDYTDKSVEDVVKKVLNLLEKSGDRHSGIV